MLRASWSLLACGFMAAAFAQEDRPRRTCTVGRVAEALAPVVDGDLGELCWADAPAIGDLVMVEPHVGGPPTQRTVVKLLHDRHTLYLALWCFDDEPGGIRAMQRERDAQLDPDDRVEILFDTFENRRTSYFFQVGAGGSIGDGLGSQNGGRFDKPWDAIWDGRSRVLATGWQAELAIPFRSIPRQRGATSWGFNLRRIVRRTGEESQWASASQAVPFFRVSEAGTMTGLGAIDEGLGVDVVPYAAATVARDRAAGARDFDVEPTGGGDLFYRLTPELTLAATAFTDFAETEVDSRQINLGRFPLFFPEKRDFFLEGASYFAFGPGGFDTPAVLPFFSRRIGLDPSGAVVPVLGGIKLTGEAGPLEIGLLAVAADPPGGRAADSLLAARLRYALAEQTAVGLIATSGNPGAAADNQVGGVDLYHRVPAFVGDLDLQVFASLLGSHTDGGGGDGHDADLELLARGREWVIDTGVRWTSDEFAPALGFVRRPGARQYRFAPEYSPRLLGDGDWRKLSFATRVDWITTADDAPDEFRAALDFAGFESHQGDSVGVLAERRFERVRDPFALFGGSSAIAAGDYWTTRAGVVAETSDGRDLSGGFEVTHGGFFDGRSTAIEAEATLRASALLHLGAEYGSSIVDLGPGRDFTTQVGELRLDLHPSARLSLRNLVQFDNESQLLGWQSRLRWIRAPGSDFFAVLGTAWERTDDESLVPTGQELTFKLQHTLRF